MSQFVLLWIKRIIHQYSSPQVIPSYVAAVDNPYIFILYTRNGLNQGNQFSTRKLSHANSQLRADAVKQTAAGA